jgi:hypothetical protein
MNIIRGHEHLSFNIKQILKILFCDKNIPLVM